MEGARGLSSKGLSYLGTVVFGTSFYQRPIIHTVRSFADACSTFVDIGAGSGMISAAVGRNFEHVVAVEASPGRLEILRETLARNHLRNCQVVSSALADKPGQRFFHHSPSNPWDNRLSSRGDLLEGAKVEVTTLDTMLDQLRLKGPFLIKIDVQGDEMLVLRGGEKTMETCPAIITEFWPWGLKTANTDPMDYVEFLQDHGFDIRELNSRRLPKEKLVRYCNAFDDPYASTDFLVKKLQSPKSSQ